MENVGNLNRTSIRLRHYHLRLRLLVPNFVTVLSLGAGLTAIRVTIDGHYDWAVGLIIAAALLDALDGHLARALDAQSRFGAELDSLVDFVNFGVAPAIILFSIYLNELPGFGWFAALVFASATGFRLARFNTMLDVEQPKWHSTYFVGMPAPAGALTVLVPLYIDRLGLLDVRKLPIIVAAHTIIIATLLVSTVPTFSGKRVGGHITTKLGALLILTVITIAASVAIFPHITLTLLAVLYLATIPVSRARYKHEEREWRAT